MHVWPLHRKHRGAVRVPAHWPSNTLLAVNHSTGKCFIDRLPTELLSRIFMEVFYGSAHSWEFVEHVCSSWRKIAFSMPHLWTSIKVKMNINLEKLRLELSRSGNLPLDIFLQLDPDPLPYDESEIKRICSETSLSTLPEALELLRSRIDRWRTLEFNTTHDERMAIFLKFLATCPPPPQLQGLAISGQGSFNHTACSPFSGNTRLPSLKHVLLQTARVDMRHWEFLQGLTSLHYYGPDDEYTLPETGRFYMALRSSPQLKELRCQCLFLADAVVPPQVSFRLNLMSLTTLSLVDMDASSTRVLCGSLILPNLRHLILNLSELEPHDGLLQHFAAPSSGGHRSVFARVKELQLSGVVCVNVATLVAAARELRELTTLKINFSNTDDAWLYLLAQPEILPGGCVQPGTIFFPKLRSLHTQYLGCKTAIKIAEKRLIAGLPLEEFHLLDTYTPTNIERHYLGSDVGISRLYLPGPGQVEPWDIQRYYEPEDANADWDFTRYASLRRKPRY